MSVRIEGTDKKAPTLLMMGHTDVVPAEPNGWTRDAVCGERTEGGLGDSGAPDRLDLSVAVAGASRKSVPTGGTTKGQ